MEVKARFLLQIISFAVFAVAVTRPQSTTISPGSCEHEGSIYPNGDRFTTEYDPCVKCSCRNGKVKCRTKNCKPSECDNPVIRPGKCCSVCGDSSKSPNPAPSPTASVDVATQSTSGSTILIMRLPPPPMIPPPPPSEVMGMNNSSGTDTHLPTIYPAVSPTMLPPPPPPTPPFVDGVSPPQPPIPTPIPTINENTTESLNTTEEGECTITCVGMPGDRGPRGKRGRKGDSGPVGPTGEKGENGVAGEDGSPGPQGPQGPQGPIGLQGLIGNPGPQGSRGPPGSLGRRGRRGPEGSPGPEGPKGMMGLPGPHGPKGLPGTSIKGEPGDSGPRGPPGISGFAGQRGLTGPPGPPGPKGEQGDFITQGRIIIVANELAMNNINTEAALAYRLDDKKLYFRDDSNWNCLMASTDLIQEVKTMRGPPGRQGMPGPAGPPGPKGEKGDTGYPSDMSNPGQDYICGNSIMEPGEQCDDENEDIHDGCIDCRRSYCGDGYRQRGVEACDGTDFDGKTCQYFFPSYDTIGNLKCTNRCQIDTGGCKVVRRRRRNLQTP